MKGKKTKSPYAKYNKVPYKYPFPTGKEYTLQRLIIRRKNERSENRKKGKG